MEETCTRCQGTGWMLVQNQDREVAVRCPCRQRDLFAKRLENSGIPVRFAGVELKGYLPGKENSSQAQARQVAEKFVAEYPAVAGGLLFQGPTGVGKTRLLCSIAHHLIQDQGTDVQYIDWNDLVREMRSGEDTTTRDFALIQRLMQRLASAELLLFDEFGASRPSPYVEDNIYFLVNRRYNDGRVTLFATNYFDRRIGAEDILTDRVSARIRSRLYEMARTVEIRGPDYRQKYQ